MVDQQLPLGERRKHRRLVRQLVEYAQPPADVAAGYLPRQRHHRRVTRLRGADSGAGIEDARTRHRHEGARFSGGFRIAIGHIGDALLVARIDDTNGVSFVVQGLEHVIHLHPGKAEKSVDTVVLHRLNPCLGAGHYRHVAAPIRKLTPAAGRMARQERNRGLAPPASLQSLALRPDRTTGGPFPGPHSCAPAPA